jgi:allantoate deiminase
MLDELGRVSDERGHLTRTFLSPAMRRANRLVGGWMRDAGLAVREDATGNLIGGLRSEQRDAPTLLIGSHLDTVRDAGRFDGALGVLLPIIAVAELRDRRVVLPFNIEVLGFSEEEGVRFSSAYLGSKGFAGRLRAADLRLRDADGISVREAIRRWNGTRTGDKRLGVKPLHRSRLLGYVEVHIDQGPVLDAEGLAVGVVSAIAGQTRGRIIFRGRAGHAGTTPMALRRDALVGAAEFTLFVESLARRSPPFVATVGTAAVSPGAPNVIPGEVILSLDVRHHSDRFRRSALRELLAGAKKIAKTRGLKFSWEVTQDNDAVACSPELSATLERSVTAIQGRSRRLVSGAGHDGVVMSSITPIAMLFVRCRGGLSHHPDEYASPADLKLALNVMVDFLERFAREQNRRSAGSPAFRRKAVVSRTA